MAYDNNDKVAHGSLSKATKKSAAGPSYIGSLTIDQDLRSGEKIWVSAWVRQGQSGPYLSLVAEHPRQQQRSAPQQRQQDSRISSGYGATRPQAPQQRNDSMDDEIPF